MKVLFFLLFVSVISADNEVEVENTTTTMSDEVPMKFLRQNDDSESSTVHFTELACSVDENAEYLTCGPRCQATCGFQPRDARRDSRAVCTTANDSGCYPGCFCKSGYVKLNDRCVLPVNCPRKYLINVTKY